MLPCNTQQDRADVHTLCRALMWEGKFTQLERIISKTGLGTTGEKALVVAEYRADYENWPYSVWPQHHMPRMPRSCGQWEEDE